MDVERLKGPYLMVPVAAKNMPKFFVTGKTIHYEIIDGIPDDSMLIRVQYNLMHDTWELTFLHPEFEMCDIDSPFCLDVEIRALA